MNSRRTRTLASIALVAALFASGCSALPLVSGDTYRVDALFERATALFPGAKVKVMGADIGRVTSVEIEETQVRAVLDIDADVPLPADVRAAIVPFTLIGERSVVLSPPWKPGMDRMSDGATIPTERTDPPFEPDEALEALRDIAQALNPDELNRLIIHASEATRGRGQDFNLLLEEAGGLAALLGSQDQVLEEISRNLQTVASGLNQREQQLAGVIRSFASVTGVLSAERESLSELLRGLSRLSDEGQLLLDDFRAELPRDLAILTQLVMIVESNIDEVAELVRAFPEVTNALLEAYEPSSRAVVLRLTGTGSTTPILNDLLSPLGFSEGDVPCLPILGVACP
jgi:phospholipid/cholesterol/gamma-HCH transport system substrate-binding protein